MNVFGTGTDSAPDNWGAWNALALHSASRWLYRKREHLSLTGAYSAKRRLEIEFSVPNLPRPQEFDPKRAPMLIANVPKGRTGWVEVTDRAAGVLPTLNANESAELSQQILFAVATRLLADLSQPITDRWDMATRQGSLLEIRRQLTSLTWPQDPVDEPRGDEDVDLWECWRVLGASGEFRALFSLARSHDSIFVEVDTTSPPDRRIVCVTYDESFDRSSEATPAVARRAAWRRLSESIGWSETRLTIVISEVDTLCPYDLDIETPEGIDLTDVRTATEDDQSGVQVSRARLGKIVRISHSVRGGALLISLRMRPQRSYPVAVLLAAGVSALILTVGWLRLRVLASTPDAASAILLAVPALFTTLVAQPVRATLAASMVKGSRAILGFCGLLTYAAAVMLVLFPVPEGIRRASVSGLLHVFWLSDMAVCWWLVFVLLSPLYGPAIQARRRRRIA